MRRGNALAAATALLAGLALVLPAPAVAGAQRWGWPLAGVPRVVREAAIPLSPWLPGHRGVDLAASAGDVVLAPADGVVAFAGSVVDRGVLTVVHAEGLRSSLEPVEPLVAVGEPVARGQPVARVAAGGHCGSGCLHWGVRRQQAYLDPLTLLRPAEPPVLLPWAGSPVLSPAPDRVARPAVQPWRAPPPAPGRHPRGAVPR